jgi:hypothetical protein
MIHCREPVALRRRILISGFSVVGSALVLGSVGLVSGCGSDKSEGQIDNPVDPMKNQGALDSMKAYQDQIKKKTGKK